MATLRRSPVLFLSVGLLFVGAFLGTAALLASGEEPPIATKRPASASDALPGRASQLARAGYVVETSRRVARDTFVVERKAHGETLLCVLSTHRGRMAGACNPKESFFGGRAVIWGMDEEGGPEKPTALWISGVAKTSVDSVRVRFDELVLTAPVTSDGGFMIEATSAALAEGRPSVLEALDADGGVISTVALPQS